MTPNSGFETVKPEKEKEKKKRSWFPIQGARERTTGQRARARAPHTYTYLRGEPTREIKTKKKLQSYSL